MADQQQLSVLLTIKAQLDELNRARADVKKLGDTVRETNGIFTNEKVLAFGGAFSVAQASIEGMVGSVKEAVTSSSRVAAEIERASGRVGLSAEAYQVLSNVIRSTGGEVSNLMTGLQRYRQQLGAALSGDKAAIANFQELGLEAGKLAKLPMEQGLTLMARGLGKFGDASREAAVAQKFFGEGGAALLPMLSQLRTEGYDKLRESTEATAGILDKDLGEAIESAGRKVEQNMERLGKGLGTTNLKMLELKGTVTGFLADNAGTIGALGKGATVGVTSFAIMEGFSRQMPGAAGQINAFGSLAGEQFKRGFGTGVKSLPGLISAALTGSGTNSIWSSIGSSIASPMGAALVLAIGTAVLDGIEAAAREARRKWAAEEAARVSPLVAGADRLLAADTPEKLAASKAEAEAGLAEIAPRLVELRANYNKLQSASLVALLSSKSNWVKELADLEEARKLYESELLSIKERGEAIVAKNAATRDSAVITARETAELLRTGALRDSLLKQEKALNFEALGTNQKKLAALQAERVEIEATRKANAMGGASPQLLANYELDSRVSLKEIDAKIAETRKKIADDTMRAADESKRHADESKRLVDEFMRQVKQAGLERLEPKKITAESALSQLEAERQRIVSSTMLDEGTKRARLTENTEAHRKAVAKLVDVMREEAKLADPAGAARLKAEIAGLQASEKDFGKQDVPVSRMARTTAAYANRNNSVDSYGSVGQGVTGGAMEWVTSVGTQASQVAATITGTLGTAVSGVSQGIYGWVTGTGSFSDAMNQMAGQVLQQIIQMGVQMGFQWATGAALNLSTHAAAEAGKVSITAGATAARIAARATETGADVAGTAVGTTAHVAGETTKTGATWLGALGRGAARTAETIWHGIQIVFRTGAHIAGEVAQTACTLVQVGLRIGATLMESIVHVIKAGVGALSSLSSIPYVGPFLGLAAMAAIVAAGMSLVKGGGKGFRSGGYTGNGAPDAYAGDVHGGEFVFSAPAVDALGVGSLNRMHQGALRGGVSAGGGGGGGGSSGGGATTIILAGTMAEAKRIQRNSYNDATIKDVWGDDRLGFMAAMA